MPEHISNLKLKKKKNSKWNIEPKSISIKNKKILKVQLNNGRLLKYQCLKKKKTPNTNTLLKHWIDISS